MKLMWKTFWCLKPRKAICNLKNGKAAGNDGMKSEMTKALNDIGVKKIL